MKQSKILFPERPFTTPFLYRFFEGVTSFSMSLGFLVGGGQMRSSLFFFYLLHALASFSFHLFSSELTYFLDISMIDLLTMERAYTTSHNLWVYPFYLTVMWFENTKSHWGLMMRIGTVILITSHLSFYSIFMWVLSLLSFVQSVRYVVKKDVFKTTLTCCLYHLYLGVISYIEAKHYNFEYHYLSWIEKLIRYCCYFLFCFCTSTVITNNKRHLNCVLTFATSVVLTPLSLYETWIQCRTPTTPYMDDLQEDIILFYIAFCTMDMIIGYWYYPEYFKWIEGILHHVVTMLFAFYFLWANKKINFCIGLIEEFSSIFLNLYRLFPQFPFFKNIFHVLFILFRIIVPVFLFFHLCHIFHDPASYTLYFSATIMNLYWLFKQFCTKQQKMNSEETKSMFKTNQ